MPDKLYVTVEIPKGSSNKYEWDDELGAIKLDRLLFSSLGYPTDYGFFRETLASDGDPLDAMVCVSEPTFPGCLIEVVPLPCSGCAMRTRRTTRSSACRSPIPTGATSRSSTTSR
jgi:inorganic pyrophosphatase